MIKKFIYQLIAVISILGFSIAINGHSNTFAQNGEYWIRPQRIPGYDPIARAPHIVADSTGTIHALSYEAVNENSNAIIYRRWHKNTGWSAAIDVIVPPLPGNQQTVQDVYLDESGWLHVIFFSGTEVGGDIYHAKAPASLASDVRAWTVPEPVGLGAGPLPYAAMTGDGQGRIYILYSGQIGGQGIYEIFSNNNGDTWADPTLVAGTKDRDQSPAHIQLLIDHLGHLNAVWSIVGEEGNGEAILYARREIDKPEWTKPYQLAAREGNDYSANWPAIIDYDKELFVVYQDDFPATLFMRRSKDNGETWSSAIQPFDHVGESEFPLLFIDSANVLHLIHGNREGNPYYGGMWHSTWNGERWNNFEPVSIAHQDAEEGYPGLPDAFTPSAPKGAIIQGNTLFLVWWNNVQRDFLSGAWYTFTELDAPQIPSVPLPTPIPTQTPTPTVQPEGTETPGGVSTPTTTFALATEIIPSSTGTNPAGPVITGTVIVLVLMAGIFIFQRIFNK